MFKIYILILLLLISTPVYAQPVKIQMSKDSNLEESLTCKWNVQLYRDQEEYKNYIVINGNPVHEDDTSFLLGFAGNIIARQGDADIFVIAEYSGGTGCPAHYRFLTIYDDGKHQLSPSFGTCSDLPQISVTDKQLMVVLPKFREDNSYSYYVWDNGSVKEVK